MVVIPQEELATRHAGEKAEVTFTHTAIADGKVGNSLCGFAVTHAEVGLQHFPGFNEHDVNLCQALILCNIAEKYDNCCKDVEEYIVLLTKAVKEMKKH